MDHTETSFAKGRDEEVKKRVTVEPFSESIIYLELLQKIVFYVRFLEIGIVSPRP